MRLRHLIAAPVIALSLSLAACSAPAAEQAPSGAASQGGSAAPSEQAGSGEASVGSRENPAPFSEPMGSANWEVHINEVTLDAWEAVHGENPETPEAPAGQQYAIVNLTTTYKGDAEGNTFDLLLEYVIPDGDNLHESGLLIPEPFPRAKQLATDESASGNMIFTIPSERADEGTLAVSELDTAPYFVTVK